VQKLQTDCQQVREREEKMRNFLSQARVTLAERSKQLENSTAKNASLLEEIKQLQTSSGTYNQ
jgi:hypothetical protein